MVGLAMGGVSDADSGLCHSFPRSAWERTTATLCVVRAAGAAGYEVPTQSVGTRLNCISCSLVSVGPRTLVGAGRWRYMPNRVTVVGSGIRPSSSSLSTYQIARAGGGQPWTNRSTSTTA